MAEKCGKCEKVFSENDVVAKCVECKLNFHATCTRAGSSHSFTKSKNKSFKCDLCAVSMSSASVRGNDDKESILEAIKSLRIDINKNIDEKIGTVLTSVSALQCVIQTLQEGVTKLDNEQEKLRDRCLKLERQNEELSAEASDLQLRLHDAEQHSRAANIEIVGLPVSPNEDIYTCLNHVANALGVNFREDDFSIAHRLRSFSDGKRPYPPIIAQFVSRRTRETWLRASRARRSLNAVDIHPSLPPSSVYVNEHLTPNNKALLGKARRLRREKRVVYAGFFNGRVTVRHSEGSEAVRVTTLDDLDKIVGNKKATCSS